MKKYTKNGVVSECRTLLINGNMVSNPTEEMILAEGWVEYIPPTPIPYTPTYEERVVALIRERYDVDSELALHRQRDTKPVEFAEYYAYCEDCKERAKENLNNSYNETNR